ncbi:MAG: vitamin K epoxide reductase [Anaerolineae bacterium]|nr:vitamin K epoxide reductase [Anaerolineae bacterium]
MRKLYLFIAILVTLIASSIPSVVSVNAQDPIVYAVLFYSPTCPHCHQVMEQDLPPLLEQYGDQLQILAVNVLQPAGAQLHAAMLTTLPPEKVQQGVPALLVGDTFLVGSVDIPAQLPGIVTAGLEQGGIDWPVIPGLGWPTIPSLGVILTASDSAESDAVTTAELLDQDSAEVSNSGFALALIVLLFLISALVFAIIRLVRARPDWSELPAVKTWVVPLLAALGLLVAGYLAYVEISHEAAVCGPIGDCNVVQSSSYATIAGVPVAVLGLLSYSAILILYIVQDRRNDMAAMWSRAALLAVTFIGTLFSIYLTVIELAVIEAVCMWCLTSAVVTGALLLLIVFPMTPQRRHNRRKPVPRSASW